MATAKNAKPTPPAAGDALLAALSEPAVAAAAIEEVAATATALGVVEPSGAFETLEGTIEEAKPAGLIKALIDALGHEIDDVASVEIRRPGLIRVHGRDRGLRSHRFPWPKTWEVAE